MVPFASRCRQALLVYLELRGREAGPLFLATSSGSHVLKLGVALRPNGLKQLLLGHATCPLPPLALAVGK
ncbi:MAG: hypothetical protein ACE5IZ_06435 [Dehalococcoidia bacterium]